MNKKNEVLEQGGTGMLDRINIEALPYIGPRSNRRICCISLSESHRAKIIKKTKMKGE
jgi:hypothetical protein